MAYYLTTTTTIGWVGDGVGQLGPTGQVITVQVAQTQIPGGDTLTTTNVSSACTTAATAIALLLNTNPTFAQASGFSTGGN